MRIKCLIVVSLEEERADELQNDDEEVFCVVRKGRARSARTQGEGRGVAARGIHSQ